MENSKAPQEALNFDGRPLHYDILSTPRTVAATSSWRGAQGYVKVGYEHASGIYHEAHFAGISFVPLESPILDIQNLGSWFLDVGDRDHGTTKQLLLKASHKKPTRWASEATKDKRRNEPNKQ
ncbi:hypothetical protein IFR05_015190 [Cadophora sp. M221]|nr:hypothetical protein IFR05_015190 [Cadophora sp. M221]